MYSNLQRCAVNVSHSEKLLCKLTAFQRRIVLFVTGLKQKQRKHSQWDSVTVNNAGRLLSFSISLGIPILSQRTRKFSLHEFK